MHSGPFASVLICLLLLPIGSCDELGEGVQADGEWAIYRLADPSLHSDQARAVPLSDLVLATEPFISMRDLHWYRWDTHTFECGPEVGNRIDSLARYEGTVRGVPFVAVVGSERIYLGSFWWAYSSVLPWCPTMDITFAGGRGANVIGLGIQLPPLHQGDDPRSDWRIYDALRRAGVLLDRLPPAP